MMPEEMLTTAVLISSRMCASPIVCKRSFIYRSAVDSSKALSNRLSGYLVCGVKSSAQLLLHPVVAEVEVLANFMKYRVDNLPLDVVLVRSVGVLVRTPPAILDAFLDGTPQYGISTDSHSTLHGRLRLRHAHSSSKLKNCLLLDIDSGLRL